MILSLSNCILFNMALNAFIFILDRENVNLIWCHMIEKYLTIPVKLSSSDIKGNMYLYSLLKLN